MDVDVMNEDVCLRGRGRTARPGVPEEDGTLRASLVYGTVTAVGASVSIVVMVSFTLSLCYCPSRKSETQLSFGQGRCFWRRGVRRAGGEGRGEQQEGGECRRLAQRQRSKVGQKRSGDSSVGGGWQALWINRPFGTPTPRFVYVFSHDY